MLTKTPDYIISEFGYPQCQYSCSKEKNTKYPHTQQSLQQATTLSPSRLLPMRETLTDYYARLLSNNNNKNGDCANLTQQHTLQQLGKQQKNIWNENVKQKINNSSKRNYLDKRRRNINSLAPLAAKREEGELNAF